MWNVTAWMPVANYANTIQRNPWVLSVTGSRRAGAVEENVIVGAAVTPCQAYRPVNLLPSLCFTVQRQLVLPTERYARCVDGLGLCVVSSVIQRFVIRAYIAGLKVSSCRTSTSPAFTLSSYKHSRGTPHCLVHRDGCVGQTFERPQCDNSSIYRYKRASTWLPSEFRYGGRQGIFPLPISV
ncbi:hypothetical protein BD311DRAFT_384272 [Dichomitus squalens]|uniref:Uncharacterized protein n=1 Tax=Dichomitus squalens TaxID=114155 RepID=A0A4Q9MJ25_9APHY|nr:hypothetical protein BD311DRAFT_384272 [Dichomitus squalens]